MGTRRPLVPTKVLLFDKSKSHQERMYAVTLISPKRKSSSKNLEQEECVLHIFLPYLFSLLDRFKGLFKPTLERVSAARPPLRAACAIEFEAPMIGGGTHPNDGSQLTNLFFFQNKPSDSV